ncbi:flagellar hook-associated protein 2 [Bacillus oleivorans]|uniref:Flagellar hook-associated protein 2 n=1 Tax=Bacillus oleivorans TaxID=1448271 RepID=A0A285D0P6_9BACI|nr:flagellar hook-associated protein 2 [Bacillus oleivorans]SNX72868.1 flagellar hook-associated protein 2 [Bacillus oleivorans]
MNMRIGGLASGMDIDKLVSDLMRAERMPLDKLNQRRTFLEWQRDDYREMNKLMFDFDQLIFNGVGRQSTFIQKQVTSSNPSAVSVKNISSVNDFSGFLSVEKLAQSATMYSSASVTDDASKTISQIDPTFTSSQVIKIQAIGEDGKLGDEVQITVNPTDTLNSVIQKINDQTDVNAFYDQGTGRVSFTAKHTGNALNADGTEAPEIILTGSFLTSTLKLSSDSDAAATDSDGDGIVYGSKGVNAEFTYNGLATTRSSNTFQINGFEVTLKQETNGSVVNFSSQPDVDKILDKIVEFVDQYNKMIEKINGEVSERRYRDYQPLTNEQKEAMSENEIKLWEEKAKSGTLYRDSVLSGGLTQMRYDFSNEVTGISGYVQLSEIGITTSSNYLDNGKLIIDEDKLREAIANDPNGVYQLFNANGDGETQSTMGIADRLRNTLKSTMDSIEKKAGNTYSTNATFSIGKTLEDLDDRISDFERRLINIENRYWSQFSAMETAIQRSNSQAMYLMQQFGGA